MEKDCKFLYETDKGCILCVKLVPNSSHNKVVDFSNEYIRIKICAPAVENKANKELISFCSEILNVNKSKLEIVFGEKSKLKKLLIKESKIDNLSQKIMFVLDSVNKDK